MNNYLKKFNGILKGKKTETYMKQPIPGTLTNETELSYIYFSSVSSCEIWIQ